MKKKLFALIIITLTLFLSACQSKSVSKPSYKVPSKAPEIDIIISSSDPATSYSEVVDSIILLNIWDKAIYDRLSSMGAINAKYVEGEPLPIGKAGHKIVIDFGEYKPDTIQLMKQYRVSNESTEISDVTNLDLVSENPTLFSYELPKNVNDALTNQYVFTLTVTWGDNSTDYAFCIEVQNTEE